MYEEKVAETETEEDESYIRKIFNSLVPQEEEEVSDKEDGGEEEKKELKEKWWREINKIEYYRMIHFLSMYTLKALDGHV